MTKKLTGDGILVRRIIMCKGRDNYQKHNVLGNSSIKECEDKAVEAANISKA